MSDAYKIIDHTYDTVVVGAGGSGLRAVALGMQQILSGDAKIVAAGGHLWACRMSVDMMKVSEVDMYDGVEAVINASDFMEKSEGGQLLFI